MNEYLKRSAWIVGTLLGCLTLASPIQGASFDCTKAQTKVGKLICADKALSIQDELLAITFKSVLGKASDPVAVKKAQRAWLKVRNSCSDADCVKRTYETRLQELLKAAETAKQNAEQIEDQVFPLNPKDPADIRRGSPKPYVLVMSKDHELCNHMLQLFNEDLESYGWDGSNFHDRHEEFKRIPWEKARYFVESDGRVSYTDVEGALFDFNNDGTQDFVVHEKSSLSGMRADRLIMLDAEDSKRSNDLLYKELRSGKNSIDIAWAGYPLSSPLDGRNEALWLLSPFRYYGASYLFMRPIAVGYLSNFAVIAKYIGGRFEYRDLTGKMEDICYYQQNGAKRGN